MGPVLIELNDTVSAQDFNGTRMVGQASEDLKELALIGKLRNW